jgi:GT2 family glycosyltransferase
MKVFALVITYNRCYSLNKAIDRLLKQNDPIDKIIVINNNSNDSTYTYLKTFENNPLFAIYHFNKNTGGAGAYYYGFNQCVSLGADWIICIEDDIILPRTFCADLKPLLEERKDEKIGFIYPKILSIENRHQIFGTLFLTQNNTIEKAQFAGLVVNAKGIQSVGLPIHSFFIYFDDWEYTLRLTQNGYIGIHAPTLYAWHNDGVRAIGKPWLSAPKKEIWKSLYGIRNELVFYKKKGLGIYTKLLLKHVLLTPISILFHRKENALYVAIKWSLWSFKSLFFNYTIDKVNSENVKRFETNYVR